MNIKDKILWKHMCKKNMCANSKQSWPHCVVCFLPIWQICEVTTIRDSKSALSFVAMKKWKIYANANNTCVEFLKTVCRCSWMSHRYAYGVNIMTAFWIPVFNMPTFSSNKSQPSFKLGLQFICNIEIMSSIFLEPIQESEWKVTFDSFLNIIILQQ